MAFESIRALKSFRGWQKASGFERDKDYFYDTSVPDKITIDFKGDTRLRDAVLSSMDSNIEWGLRITDTRKSKWRSRLTQ